jgi:hypothetical protein
LCLCGFSSFLIIFQKIIPNPLTSFVLAAVKAWQDNENSSQARSTNSQL